MDDLLGTAPDTDIATMLDLPVGDVQRRRQRLGV